MPNNIESVHAAFDFDKTLTTQDSLGPFLQRVAGRGRLYSTIGVHPLSAIGSLYSGDSRNKLKEKLLKACFAGRSVDDVETIAADHAGEILAKFLRSDVIQRMRWHQDQGHIVSIVSASLDTYLKYIARELEVGYLCSTELEQPESGILTGLMQTPNCRGPEKVRRIELLGISAGTTYAYGDSKGDAEMLAWADYPTLVTSAVLSVEPKTQDSPTN